MNYIIKLKLLLFFIFLSTTSTAYSQGKAHKIGVILNDVDITETSYAAIQKIITQRVEVINGKGGIDGRKIKVEYMNDKANIDSTKSLVNRYLKDKSMIAMVGCWNSTRAREIVDKIGQSGIPWLGDFAIIDPAVKYENILSLDKGMDNEIEVFKNFIERKADSSKLNIGFVGRAGDLYTERFANSLRELQEYNENIAITLEKWYPQGELLSETELDYLNQEITKNTNFLIFSRGKENTTKFIDKYRESNKDIPIMTLLAPLGPVLSSLKTSDSIGEFFDINVVGIPNALNIRFEEQLNEIKKKAPGLEIDPLGIGYAGKYSDAIALIVDAAKKEDLNIEEDKVQGDTSNLLSYHEKHVISIRNRIVRQLQRYTNYKKYYKGWFANYSFNSEGSRSGDVLLVWKPKTNKSLILAPIQYLHQGKGKPTPTPVLYTNIDMVSIDHIDDKSQTFRAVFYIEITAKQKIDISDIKFSNAARSEADHAPLVEKQILSEEKNKDNYHLLAKVSGKFYFSPDHRLYPFDNQNFNIFVQATNSLTPFLIQPTDEELRDKNFETSGWSPIIEFVGYRNDFINSVKNFGSSTQVIPVYSFSFSYILQRGHVDFYRKIVIPIAIMLLITYSTTYIGLNFFEAIAGIQVTSFLACVALYFSVYKVSDESSTISDNIFIFSYFIITSMTMASVVRLYYKTKRVSAKLSLKNPASVALLYQRICYPLFILIGIIILIIWTS